MNQWEASAGCLNIRFPLETDEVCCCWTFQSQRMCPKQRMFTGHLWILKPSSAGRARQWWATPTLYSTQGDHIHTNTQSSFVSLSFLSWKLCSRKSKSKCITFKSLKQTYLSRLSPKKIFFLPKLECWNYWRGLLHTKVASAEIQLLL